MKNPKNITVYIIIALVIGIIVCFYLNSIDENMYDYKLRELSDKSIVLMRKNDSLAEINKQLDIRIDSIKQEKLILEAKVVNTKIEIEKINKKRYEILNHVNNLSANDVSDEFSNYLNEKTESGNTN